MSRLSQSDLDQALGFLRAAEAVDGEEPFPSVLLDRLRELVHSDVVYYCELDRRGERLLRSTGCGRARELEGAVPDEVDRLFWRLRHQHPVCVYQDETHDFAARKLSDFVTGRELRRLEIYDEFFRPYGVEYQLDVGLPAPPTHTKVFLFDNHRVDFTERDRLLLDLLRPHLAFLYAAARDRRVVAALEATAEARRSVLVLGREGQIEFAGADTRSLLDRYFPHHGGLLPEALADWARHDATPPGDSRRLIPPRRPFTIERVGQRLVVRRVGRVLLLREEHATLTRREHEILELAAAGRSNAEIASELFIAPGTVRVHLQHAYEKLGVRNRTAAAALLAADRPQAIG